MPVSYDVIVLGAGSPGEHCAGELADGGARVAIVERALAGGECSYWACIPSKTLLRPGEAAHAARAAAVTAQVDVAAALAYRDFMVSNYSDAGQERWLTDKGIDLLRGTGRIAGVGAVEVEGVPYTAGHIVVATGSDPVVPPVPGLADLEGVWSNREVTGMKAVPRRLLILGGGPVGAEMAQAVRRLGGEVVLVEAAGHVLAREPTALGEALGEVLRDDGVELILGIQATAARRDGDEYVLALGDGREVRGDHLLLATGRRPRVDGIGLETVGVTADRHGIPVDANLRAGERLWAIGDVTGVRLLTHVGKYQGEVVAANILGESRAANYEAIPDVVYTDPQAASVGATEAAFIATAPLSEVAKTATYTHDYAKSKGFLTLLSDGDVVTGAYALGPEAGEWLQQATLAILAARIPLDVLRDTIQPFPTFSEIYVAALKALHSQIGAGAPGGRAGIVASLSPRPSLGGAVTATESSTNERQPELVDQTVVVIGGSSGIGLETARRARSEGANVVLTGRDPDRLERAAKEVDARSTAAFDATDEAQLERFFNDLPPRIDHAPIDHVMVTAGGSYYAPLVEMDFAKVRRSLDEHFLLPVQIARHGAVKMRPGGTLVFMTGSGARRPGVGLAVAAILAAGLPALTANLALEVAPVRVNLIAAGFVDTPLSASVLGADLEKRRDQLRAELPIRRVVGPADVAALAVHLMTNTALTGATYDIDGGEQVLSGV